LYCDIYARLLRKFLIKYQYQFSVVSYTRFKLMIGINNKLLE